MAVSAKSSGLPHSSEILNPHFPKNRTPKRLTFSPSLKPSQISSRNTQELSVLTASSVNTNNNTNEDLCRLCLQGEFKKALSLLDSMEELNIRVEEDAYVALVRLCEWKRGHEESARVYSYIRNSFALFSVRLGNALLSMFVRFGNLVDAWYVFGKMEERNLFSWNVLLGGYAKSGFFDEALNLYHRMLWVGIRPDIYTFPCVLRTCGGLSDLGIGRETHLHVLRFGFESDIDVNNALITMYVKCGDLDAARLVFDKMPRRDGISWNAVISGCFENGEFLEGFKLFFAMMNLSVPPNSMTMTSLISGCELVAEEGLGKEIHGYAIKTKFVDEVSVSNSLLLLYSSLGYLDEAEKIFARIGIKDVVSWTTMISGYDNNDLPGKAIETYEAMEREGTVSVDEIAITSTVSACACLGDLKTGTKLHDLANRTGFIHYVSLANTLVDMYSKCKQPEKALEVFHRIRGKNVISWTTIITGLRINQKLFESLLYFRQMIQAKAKPNSITLLAAVSACARIGALGSGKEIHAQALRTGCAFEAFLPNALLDMYVKCGKLRSATNQFRSGEKDVSAWNIMLTWYAQRRQGELALALFRRMPVPPDEVTFIALLRAFSRSGMVSQGLEIFEAMEKIYSIAPNPRHYACVVDLLGRAGKLEEAHEFILAMPVGQDSAVWGALLNSCRIHRRVDLGELAAQRIFEDEDKDEDERYYVLLSKLYAESGKWDEVARLRWRMRERGLTVDPGCSWVEVKGKVHAFLSGDESHPRKKEIDAVLEGFRERMKEGGTVKAGSAKDEIFCGHSERQAVAFGLISTAPGTPVWVTKNLYMCKSCHDTIKFISSVLRRDISVRDAEELHCFKDGSCSCGDEAYWGSRSDN